MSANPFEEPAAGGREATVVHIDRKPESDGPASLCVRAWWLCVPRACPQPAVRARSHSILKARLDTILKVTRFINVLNGIGLAFSCYFAFTVVSGSITRFFLALYIGCVTGRRFPCFLLVCIPDMISNGSVFPNPRRHRLFAVLLLAFELRVKATEPTVKRLFGFMYSYTGRTAFLCL